MAKAPAITKCDYTTRWATQRDFGRILSFFRPTYVDDTGTFHRPSTVFERTRRAFADVIGDDRALLLVDAQDNIRAFGAIHLHAASVAIGHQATDISATDNMEFNIAEIGSIYRPGEEPSGFCAELLYDILIMQVMKKARECTIGMLITQIVANNQKGIDQVIRLHQGWQNYFIVSDYKESFQNSLANSADKEIQLAHYRADPKVALLAAAKSLLGIADSESPTFCLGNKTGVIEAFDLASKRKVSINIAPTGFHETANQIALREQQIARATNGSATWMAFNQMINTPAASLV